MNDGQRTRCTSPRASKTPCSASASGGAAGAVWCRRSCRSPATAARAGCASSAASCCAPREDADDPTAERITSIRGWRSFTSVHVADAEVRRLGGQGEAHDLVRPRWRARCAHRGEAPARLARHPLSIEGGDAVDAPVFVVADDIDFGLRLRHRRHRDGHRAPPPVPRGVEHLRARRARPHAGGRDGGALRAPAARAPRHPGDLPVDGRMERGARR